MHGLRSPSVLLAVCLGLVVRCAAIVPESNVLMVGADDAVLTSDGTDTASPVPMGSVIDSVTNDAGENGNRIVAVVNETNPKPKPLRCVVYPGEGIGSRINCDAVCEKVCVGLVDCPCNDNGRDTDCWVPRSEAKAYCAEIEDCHVISMYRGTQDTPAVKTYDSWAHLGGVPIGKKKGFVATVCDKEAAGICYDCPANSCPSDAAGPAREACYRQAYTAATYAASTPFCHNGFSASCGDAADRSCCTLKTNSYCSPIDGACIPEAPLCPSSTVKGLIKAGGVACEQWVRDVVLRTAPPMSETCTCLKSIQNLIGTKAGLAYECALVPGTRTLTKLATDSCESTAMPCTEGDQCKGCTRHLKVLDDKVTWQPLQSADKLTKQKCGLDPERNRCVLISGDKTTLKAHIPCAGDNYDTDSTPGDAVFVTPPDSSHWGRKANKTKTSINDYEHLPHRGDPVMSKHLPPAPLSILESLGPEPPSSGWPVDFNSTTIGNAITHRHYTDATNRTVSVVLTGCAFPDVGKVESWSFYAAREGRVHAQVLRAVDPPSDLSRNPDPVTAYRVVGENVLHATKPGPNSFQVPEDSRIAVTGGDLVGFYSRGVVSWSEGGEPVLFRYGDNSNPTIGTHSNPMLTDDRTYRSTDLIFVGDGTLRTYSIAATGQFPGYVVPISESPSPTASPSPSTSADPSASPSPSHTPSVSPSSSTVSRCHEGPAFYCGSEELRKFCNVSHRVYELVCPQFPKCDASARCPLGMLPKALLGKHSSRAPASRCFDPALDCVRSPCSRRAGTNSSKACDMYTFNNVHGFASSGQPAAPLQPVPPHQRSANATTRPAPVCPGAPYCAAGADWTGRCAKGKRQSPVKVTWGKDMSEKIPTIQVVEPNYTVADYELTHTGWGMVLSGDLGSLNMDGQDWDAVAVMIHAPAEHQVEGQPRSDVELQIMHNLRYTEDGRAAGAETLAVAIFLDADKSGGQGDTTEGFKLFGKPLPPAGGKSTVVSGLDLNSLVSKDSPRVLYTGSLTTPPCSEGVQWSLQMGANRRISKEQVANINSVFKSNPHFAMGRGNNRALQPLNGRVLSLKSSCGPGSAIACAPDDVQPPPIPDDEQAANAYGIERPYTDPSHNAVLGFYRTYEELKPRPVPERVQGGIDSPSGGRVQGAISQKTKLAVPPVA